MSQNRWEVGLLEFGGERNGRPVRHGTAYYAIVYSAALALIAVLALASHFLVDRIVALESTTSTVVKIAARQTTLSQRISGLSFQFAMSSESEREQLEPLLRRAIGLMRSSHEALIRGDEQLGIPERIPDEVDNIYFSEDGGLDQRVRRFLVLAEDFLNLPSVQVDPRNQGLVRLMGASQDTLLDELTRAVTAYEEASKQNIQQLRTTMYGLIIGLLIILLLEAVFVFRPLFRNLVKQRESLFDMARRDPLTGCLNRRSIIDAAANEIARFRRYKKPLTFAMLDIDYFKKVNDTHGHSAGDQVLKELVRLAENTVRTTDIFGRIGGEEFAVVLPETDLQGAQIMAEKLRASIENHAVDVAGTPIKFTVSIGLGEALESDRSEQQALSRADNALYQAKNAGRNRVAVFDMGHVPGIF